MDKKWSYYSYNSHFCHYEWSWTIYLIFKCQFSFLFLIRRSCLHIKEVKHLPYIAFFFQFMITFGHVYVIFLWNQIYQPLLVFVYLFIVPWLKRPSIIFDHKNFSPVFWYNFVILFLLCWSHCSNMTLFWYEELGRHSIKYVVKYI